MGGSSHLQKKMFPNNTVSVLNENIRFYYFGTSQQYHIYTEKVIFIPDLSALYMIVQATLTQTYRELIVVASNFHT